MHDTRSRFALTTLVATFFLFNGCATIMSGSSQQVSFQSNPDGATVNVGGRIIGKTPITTALKRVKGQQLTFEKEGYKPLSMQLETRMNSWFWGNIVLGGLIGSTTDGLSGAVDEYAPSQYMVTLQPTGTATLDSHTSQTQSQRVKEFVVTAYRDVSTDIKKGSGTYLNSLYDLLKIKPEQSTETLKRLRALLDAYPNIADFADRVGDLSVPEPSPAVPTIKQPSTPANNPSAIPENQMM